MPEWPFGGVPSIHLWDTGTTNEAPSSWKNGRKVMADSGHVLGASGLSSKIIHWYFEASTHLQTDTDSFRPSSERIRRTLVPVIAVTLFILRNTPLTLCQVSGACAAREMHSWIA